MSFEAFLRLAEENQAKNDEQIKKLTSDMKRKKELLKKQMATAMEVNSKLKQPSPIPSKKLMSQKSQEKLKSLAASVTYTPTPIQLLPQRKELEYIPSVSKQKRPISSLMNVLEEMKGKVSGSEYSPAAYGCVKIPKIPRISLSGDDISKSSQQLTVNSIASNNKLQKSDSSKSSFIKAAKNVNNLHLNDERTHTLTSNKANSLSFKKELVPVPKTKSLGIANQQSLHSSRIPSYQHNTVSDMQTKSVQNQSLRPVISKTSSLHLSTKYQTKTGIANKISSAPAYSPTPIAQKLLLHNTSVRTVGEKTSSLTTSHSSKQLQMNKIHNSVQNHQRQSTNCQKLAGIATQCGSGDADVRKEDHITQSTLNNRKSKKPSGIAAQLSSAPFQVLETSSYPLKEKSVKKGSECENRRPFKPESKSLSVKKPHVVVEARKLGSSLKSIPRSIAAQQPKPRVLFQGIGAQQGGRGIAAQFGGVPVMCSLKCDEDVYSGEESDEYASDDSFIDDTDVTSAKEYIRAVKDIHQSLKFDPKKYDKVSKYDDLSSMESSYRMIEKEEKISARLGEKEDTEDIAAETERRQRRAAKLGVA